MYLVKSCRKEHNVKTSDTLMLGSLYYYRSVENLEIRDEGEGTATYEISIDGPIAIDRGWLNTILQGAVKHRSDEEPHRLSGELDINLHTYHWLPGPAQGPINVNKLHATIKRQCFNSFVFCMSSVETPEVAEEIFKGYEDYWMIPESKSEALAGEIARALDKAVREGRRTGNHVIDPNISFDDLTYHCQRTTVMYTSREVLINHHSAVTAEEFLKRLTNIAFLKPLKFSHEKEYRFCFTLEANDLIVDIWRRHLLVDSSEVRKLL